MKRDDLRQVVTRRVREAFAIGEILDANKIAGSIAAEEVARGIDQTTIAEMILAEAARYGGSGTKVGD